MEKFSKFTVLGLTFGVFLAGYAVFAFTPPTQTPPEGNVSAPINTGPEKQTKQGGFRIKNWLFADGGVRTGLYTTSSRPACDTTIKGTLIFNTTSGQPNVCNGSSWNEYTGPKGDSGEGSSGGTGPQGQRGEQGPAGPPGS